MEHIYDFDTYSVNEKNNLGGWKRIVNKLKSDLNLNFFFVATFGATIDVFYPVMLELFQNHKLDLNLNKSQICLLTLTAIAVLLNENKDSIRKLKQRLKEEKISHLLTDAINAIKSIKTLVGNVLVKLGHILSAPGSLIDLFGYTALLVPTIVILKKLLSGELSDITMDDFIGLGLNYSLAVSSFLIKQLVSKLTNWVKTIFEKPEPTNESGGGNIKSEGKPDGYFPSAFYEPSKELKMIDHMILELLYNEEYTASQIIRMRKFSVNDVINSLAKLNEKSLIYKNPENIIRLYPEGRRIILSYLKHKEKENELKEHYLNILEN
jgi:hypothetical protein